MRPAVKSIRLSTGVTLPYAEQGNAAGVPVILLHGVTDSWHSFAPVLPYLPASMRAIALTQRGHGDADRPARGYQTRDFAADVTALMDALEIEAAVVVGHSMGSANAMRFAIEYPERTRALVLAGAFADFAENPAVVEFWRSTILPLRDPIDASIAREFQESTLAQPIPAALLDLAVRESLKVPARVWRAAFEGLLEEDFVGELELIEAPTLILWGAQDGFCPRGDQDTLLRAIRHARLTVYAKAGHALHWEEPERLAKDVVAFVRSVVSQALMT